MSELIVPTENTMSEEEQQRKSKLDKFKAMGAVGMGMPMMLPVPGQGKIKPTEIK